MLQVWVRAVKFKIRMVAYCAAVRGKNTHEEHVYAVNLESVEVTVRMCGTVAALSGPLMRGALIGCSGGRICSLKVFAANAAIWSEMWSKYESIQTCCFQRGRAPGHFEARMFSEGAGGKANAEMWLKEERTMTEANDEGKERERERACKGEGKAERYCLIIRKGYGNIPACVCFSS